MGMPDWVESSIREHRELEVMLDRLGRAIGQGNFAPAFRIAKDGVRIHYANENGHWSAIGARKIMEQHADVEELAEAVEDALGADQSSDALSLVNRFLALASHNLIEEERDWFPLL
jgi:hypothetical protein